MDDTCALFIGACLVLIMTQVLPDWEVILFLFVGFPLLNMLLPPPRP